MAYRVTLIHFVLCVALVKPLSSFVTEKIHRRGSSSSYAAALSNTVHSLAPAETVSDVTGLAHSSDDEQGISSNTLKKIIDAQTANHDLESDLSSDGFTQATQSPCHLVLKENYVNCSSRGITVINPRWFPLNTRKITLDHNSISTLYNGTFQHLKYLLTLNISSSGVSAIEVNALRGLVSLETLDLENNNLPLSRSTSFPPGMFNNLTSLLNLFIAYNNKCVQNTFSLGRSTSAKDNIPSPYPHYIDIFECLPNLQSLSIDTFFTLYLGPEFEKFPNLTNLILFCRETYTVTNDSFEGLANVRLRHLEMRQFAQTDLQFEVGVFQPLIHLDSLVVYRWQIGNHNMLRLLWPFENRNLSVLALYGTHLTRHYYPPRMIFEDGIIRRNETEHLRHICISEFTLSSSRIFAIEPGAADSPVWLQCIVKFDVSDNPLELEGYESLLYVLSRFKRLQYINSRMPSLMPKQTRSSSNDLLHNMFFTYQDLNSALVPRLLADDGRVLTRSHNTNHHINGHFSLEDMSHKADFDNWNMRGDNAVVNKGNISGGIAPQDRDINISGGIAPQDRDINISGGIAPQDRDINISGGIAPQTRDINISGGIAPQTRDINISGGIAPQTRDINISGGIAPQDRDINISGGIAPQTRDINISGGIAPQTRDINISGGIAPQTKDINISGGIAPQTRDINISIHVNVKQQLRHDLVEPIPEMSSHGVFQEIQHIPKSQGVTVYNNDVPELDLPLLGNQSFDTYNDIQTVQRHGSSNLTQSGEFQNLEYILPLFTIRLPPLLKVLDLGNYNDYNVLHMDSNVFIHGENLVEMYAINMPLFIFGTGRLIGLHNLKVLDVSGSLIDVGEYFMDDFPALECFIASAVKPERIVKLMHHGRFLRNLTNLRYLDISNNDLNFLFATFSSNPNLTYLSLAKNRFSSIPFDLSTTPNLEVLDLTDNVIRFLTEPEMDAIDAHVADGKFFTLKLEGNSLTCVCSRIRFLAWQQTTLAHFDKDGNYSCTSENGHLAFTKDFQDILGFWRQCEGRFMFMVSLVLASLLAVAMLTAYLTTRYRTAMMAFFLRVFAPQFRPRTILDYKTAVFVGYADDDYRFVRYVLQRYLEEDLKVSTFIHQRDLDVGYKDQLFYEAIQNSWRILLVITDNFLHNYDMANIIMKYASYSVSPVNSERVLVLAEETQLHNIPDFLHDVLDDNKIISLPHMDAPLDYRQQQTIKNSVLPRQ